MFEWHQLVLSTRSDERSAGCKPRLGRLLNKRRLISREGATSRPSGSRMPAGSTLCGSDAQAAQDPLIPLVAEARNNLERVVRQLARRRSTDEGRLRPASNVRHANSSGPSETWLDNGSASLPSAAGVFPTTMGFVGVGSISAEGRCRLNDRAPSKLGRCGDG